jgi:peptidoglycan hydrolase-like protein with peptidoglycan-binding domain
MVLVVLGVFVLGLSGCATGRRQKDLEAQGLKNQISLLETQVQSKDAEINNLSEALAKCNSEKSGMSEDMKGKRVIGEPKWHPKMRQIQTALKNAGYDPGDIDGKAGKKTREAIRNFQKANNLPVDGRVGKQTWAVLKEYLNKKVK